MIQTERPTNVVRLEGRTPVHATGDNVTIQIGGTYVTRTTQPEEDDNKHPNEKDLEWMHGA